MKNSSVRLSGLSIQNFKNIKNGELSFYNRRKNYRASILGLYGQNGSGKTALVDVMQLLKYILCGKSIPEEMADFVHVDTEEAVLTYTLEVIVPDGKYEAFCKVHLGKEEYIAEQNLEMRDAHSGKSRLIISDEIFSYSFEGSREKIRKGPFIDTRTEKIFVPAAKYDCLIGKEKTK